MRDMRQHEGPAASPARGAAGRPAGAAVRYLPYVPRITLDWLRSSPDELVREVDGTMAFVDISGFTAMSEKLVRSGKAGAEEVVEVMNTTFAALLDVAYGYGGSLLKFGGDALLLFFPDPGHAPRACRAAWGMRQALKDLGRPRTSAGQVTLRMHVGVNTGVFHFFLVGDAHRELIVAGPETSRTVLMEGTSEAGEILVSRATAALLQPRELGAAKGEGVLLGAAPEAEGLVQLRPDVGGIDLGSCLPVAIRDHLAAETFEPEHRHAAIAFVNFQGSDALLEREGAAAAAEAVAELVTVIQSAAAEHGVTFLESDVDRDGGRIVLVAGAPGTSGDDEERILRTVRAIADAGCRLSVRIGVSRGRVFAGEVGATFRRTYTILGDTAALAARLMARAQPGRILAPAEVLDRSKTAFETTELEPLQLKGKAKPVVAFDVGPLAGTRSVAERKRLPLVGREREMAILGAALAPVRLGYGSLVEIIGDPGVGKSRLVAELKEQASDLCVETAECEPYESSTPYFPFRRMLRALLGVELEGSPAANSAALRARLEPVAPDLIPWIPLLAIPLDAEVEPTTEADELEPAFRRLRLNAMVTELLTKLLPGPTLIVIEDVHWMDEASTDLVRYAAGQIASKPLLICATRRVAGTGLGAAEGLPALSIRLEPLTPEAARKLVELSQDGRLPEHEIEAIAGRAGGNPLFLQELVASAQDEVEAEGEELPENVEGMVVARIDKLAPPDRALLRYGAVVGPTFSEHLLERLLDEEGSTALEEGSWERLAEFVERDPYDPRTFRFRHALFRDAAYEGLSFRRRRELHRRVGETFEREPGDHTELLSLHFLRAQEYEKAWQYSLAAGEEAQAKFANVEAAEFYNRALEASRHVKGIAPAEIARVSEALGDVCELAGLYADAADAYKTARQRASGERAPELLLKEGVIRERQGRYAEALRWYSRGLAETEKLTDERARAVHRVELGLAYAGVRHRQGRHADCISWCRGVLDDAHALGHQAGLARAYYLLHVAYTYLGDPERVSFRGLSLPVYEELGDLLGQANVLCNLGIDAYWEGRWEESLDLYERSRQAMERIGDVVGGATMANNIGEILSDQGRLADAERLFTEAAAAFDAAGSQFVQVARGNLGRAAARAGRADEAEALLREGLATFEAIGAEDFVAETEARLVEVSVLAGDHDAGLARADELLAEAGNGDGAARRRPWEGSANAVAMVHRLRGYARMQAGGFEAARASLDTSLALAREASAEYEVALTLEARARLAALTGENGGADAAEAAAIFERLGVVSTPTVPLPEPAAR